MKINPICPMIPIVLILNLTQVFAQADVLSNAQIFSRASEPYGINYDIWANRWWQWHISVNPEVHPWVNSTSCPVGEFGPVAFLTHKISGRQDLTCEIPAGKGIIVSIATGECDYGTEKTNDEKVLRKCADEGQNFVAMKASLDGKKINNLYENKVASPFFNISIPAENIYAADPGSFNATVGGYFAFFKPLPVGDHELKIGASVVNDANPSLNFAYNVNYLLNVK